MQHSKNEIVDVEKKAKSIIEDAYRKCEEVTSKLETDRIFLEETGIIVKSKNTFTLFFRLTTFVVAQFIAPLTFMVCLKFTHEPKRKNNYGFHYNIKLHHDLNLICVQKDAHLGKIIHLEGQKIILSEYIRLKLLYPNADTETLLCHYRRSIKDVICSNNLGIDQ